MENDARSTWQAALNGSLDPTGLFARCHVIAEVDSTQDEARRLALPVGSMLAALRQTRGRGRLGRSWHDTGQSGVALTAVLPTDDAARLSIRCAVAAALAVESMIDREVGIKWPNDLILGGRKIGGILVELCDERALGGIGINVSQVQWPAHLAGRAASLLECGCVVDRLALVSAVAGCMSKVWKQDDASLIGAFHRRDVLSGRTATLEHDRLIYSGTITAIDPMRSLTISAELGPVTLPALSTRVLSVGGM